MQDINIYQILISYSAFLIAITFHEYAHAWMANRLGDPTPAKYNRLEFNPITIIKAHPFGAGLVPLIGAINGIALGWASTPVNPYLVNRKYSIRQAERLISIAGPMSNLILAVISSFILVVVSGLYMRYLQGGNADDVMFILISTIYDLSRFSLSINLLLSFFNMIPIPPLDGFSVLSSSLDRNHPLIRLIIQYQQVFFIFILLFAGRMLHPIISNVSMMLIELMGHLSPF
jgi:Zn-dependent protease